MWGLPQCLRDRHHHVPLQMHSRAAIDNEAGLVHRATERRMLPIGSLVQLTASVIDSPSVTHCALAVAASHLN